MPGLGTPDADARVWLEASPAALAQCSADGRLGWVNTAAVTLLNLDAASIGQHLDHLLGLKDAECTRLQHTWAEGGSSELLCQGEGRDGWFGIDVRVLADGKRLLALRSLQRLKTQVAEAERLHELLALAGAVGRIGVWERNLPLSR